MICGKTINDIYTETEIVFLYFSFVANYFSLLFIIAPVS